MKKLFLLFLFLTLTSCAAQNHPYNQVKTKATVSSIAGGTATIKTNQSGIDYLVEAEDVELQKEYWFKLTKIEQLDFIRTRRATIIEKPVKTCKTVNKEAEAYLEGAVEFPEIVTVMSRGLEIKLTATVVNVDGDWAQIRSGDIEVDLNKITGLEAGKEYHFRLTDLRQMPTFMHANVIGTPVKTCQTVLAEAREYFKATNL